jgi:hypothetical protein
MKKAITFIFFALMLISQSGHAQPSPFQGSLFFNLNDDENAYKPLTPDEVKSKNIRFLSYNKRSVVKYDTIQKAFSFTTEAFERKQFAIVYEKDTVYIDYPSIDFGNAVFVKTPIPLKGKSYSFYNDKTYDALHSNGRHKVSTIFYLCEGCLISRYEMTEETKKQLKRYPFPYTINLEQ